MINVFEDFLKKNYSRLLLVLCLIFVSLCLLHFFSQRPFWNDEQCVFENIKGEGYLQLFAPLSHVQVFPRVHLITIKAISALFSYKVLAVRSLSLVLMLCAFSVWVSLYRLSFKNRALILLTTAAFVCSQKMSYYSAEFKPYSMDVLTVGLFAALFQYQKNFLDTAPSARLYLLSIVMPLLILFSYAGLFVFWMISFNYLLMLKGNKKLLPVMMLNAAASVICFYVLYLLDLRYSIAEHGLYTYWKDYFLSMKSSYGFISPFGEGLREIATFWYGNSKFFIRAATPFIPLFIFSLFYYGVKGIKNDRFRIFSLDVLSIFLFFELIVLSLFRKYPFTGDRVTLFFAPLVFYLTVKGIDSLKRIKVIKQGFILLYIVYLIMCFLNALNFYFNLYV